MALYKRMMFSVVDSPLSQDELTGRLFSGEILLFPRSPYMRRVMELTRAFCENRFSPLHPTNVHTLTPIDEQMMRLSSTQKDYNHSDELHMQWTQLFHSLELSTQSTFIDRLLLRFQTHQDDQQTPTLNTSTAPLPLHRDTWGSNIYAQVNWWAPIYPISVERTMTLCPALFRIPLNNTSAAWDLPTVIERNRATRHQGVRAEQVVPSLCEEIAGDACSPVLIEPGQIIAFSGAHLHGSVANHTGVTRVSVETRTVCLEDVYRGRGAPNMDGHAKWMSPGWFRRLSDDVLLSDVLGVTPQCPYLHQPAHSTNT